MTNTDIYNLRKEIQKIAIEAQNEYYSTPHISKVKIKYLTLGEIYDSIKKKNNESELKEFAEYLVEQSNKYRQVYDKKLALYEKENDPTLRNDRVRELNDLVARINAYNVAYNIINKYLNLKDVYKETKKTSRREEKITPKKVAPKPVSNAKEEPKIEETVTFTPSSDEDKDISNRIIYLLQKDRETDEENTEYRKQLYELRVQREEKLKDVIPNYRVVLTELESIENMISISSNQTINEMNLDKMAYIKELRSTINAINEYHFAHQLQIRKYFKNDPYASLKKNDNDFYKKYHYYVRKFHVLINSLFGTNNISFKLEDKLITTDDLIAYLGTCNLDGDYSVYKTKFEEDRIGTIDTSKKTYESTLKFLNDCITKVCNIASGQIGDKKIKLVDNEPTRNDLIEKRDLRLSQINEYLSRKGGMSHATR